MPPCNVNELEQCIENRVYPECLVAVHPYEDRMCEYAFCGVMGYKNRSCVLYNADNGFTVSLETIITRMKRN